MKKAVVVALGLALALTGCSKDKSDDDPGKAKSSEKTSAAESFPADVVNAPPKLANAKNANGAFEISECPVGPGDVVAAGTLKPKLGKRTDYVITVTWKAGGKPVARSSAVVVDAKKGEESSFEIRAALSKKADSCKVTTKSGTYKS